MSRHAVTSVPIHPLLAARHSTRAFQSDASISDAQLAAMLEAARWAPSAGNSQPSRFIVGRHGGEVFEKIVAALNPGNQGWAKHASVLVVGVRVVSNERGPLRTSAYDLGQSMAHLTVQALAEGLTVRQMGGFKPELIMSEFSLPDNTEPVAVAAIGFAGNPADLPDDLRGPDDSPRVRHGLDELVLDSD
ncbi:nitroreductase family protein [Stackebrandtia endophytica]|uniref:nitroreductase family protein n=1 Tax=Stackebrandtia endophytica TaxID=1496996 RepID=UPI001476C2BA|nr:nitroreductase family protein [Stackebrandtia endophytica]